MKDEYIKKRFDDIKTAINWSFFLLLIGMTVYTLVLYNALK